MHFDDIIIEIIYKLLVGEKVDIEFYLNKYPEYREMILDKLRTLDFIKKGFKEQDLKDRELGEYIVLQELGRGGMGAVFLAIQPSLSRLIALKVLPPNLAYYKEALKNFQEEARTIAKFNHPNIIPVYSIGKEKGFNYIAMAYIAGLSLNNFVEKIKVFKNLENLKASDIKNAIKPDSVDNGAVADKIITLKRNPAFLKQTYYQLIATLFGEISEAISYAHQNGIIHGDLKPSNILLTNELMPIVADFGLSKDMKKLASSKSKEFSGTLIYAAPEQIKGNIINEKTDIWSLGVALYELLTLRNPFLDKSIEKIAYQILHVDPLPLKNINKKIPIELEAITLKCLEKNPEKRYISALELSQDLRNYLASKPIKAKPIGPIGRALKWSKRHPALAGLTSFLIVATLLLACLSYNYKVNELIGIGDALKQLDKFDNARTFYRKISGKLPRIDDSNFVNHNREDLFLNLAKTYSLAGKHDIAFEYYKKCYKINSSNLEALTAIAWMYWNNYSNYKEAEKYYQLILEIDINHYANNNYADMLDKLGRKTEELECYKRYLATHPDSKKISDRYYALLDELNLQKK